MLPKEDTVDKFARLLHALKLNRGKLVGIKQMQEFAGLLEFVSRFTDIGFIPVCHAHACLRVPLRTKAPVCPVSNELLDAAEKVLEAIRLPEGVPLTRDPFVLHFGKHGFTSDARGLARNMQGG